MLRLLLALLVVSLVACDTAALPDGGAVGGGSVGGGSVGGGSVGGGSVGGGSVGGGSAGGGSVDAGVRHVRLGFSPFGATATVPFGAWTYDFLSRADFVALHADDFFGLPFAAFSTYPPTTLPASWVADWDAFAMPAVQSGKPIFLSLSPLTSRSRVIKNVFPDGGINDKWDPVDAGVNRDTLCYSFFDSQTQAIATAYVNYARWLIARYHPAQLAVATETDIQFYKCPWAKENFKNFIRTVRDVVAAQHPGLPVFMTFSLEDFYANGLGGSLSGCGPLTADACFTARLDEAISLTGDAGLGFSTYPQGWFPRTQEMPADRFQRIRARTSQPLWITETGWATVPVRLSNLASTCNDPMYSYYDSSSANELRQDSALASTLALAEDAGLSGVVWWLSRDYLDPVVASTCPCTPSTHETCQRVAIFNQLDPTQSSDFFYRVYGNMGLWRPDGGAKPALSTWDRYRALPLR